MLFARKDGTQATIGLIWTAFEKDGKVIDRETGREFSPLRLTDAGKLQTRIAKAWITIGYEVTDRDRFWFVRRDGDEWEEMLDATTESEAIDEARSIWRALHQIDRDSTEEALLCKGPADPEYPDAISQAARENVIEVLK